MTEVTRHGTTRVSMADRSHSRVSIEGALLSARGRQSTAVRLSLNTVQEDTSTMLTRDHTGGAFEGLGLELETESFVGDTGAKVERLFERAQEIIFESASVLTPTMRSADALNLRVAGRPPKPPSPASGEPQAPGGGSEQSPSVADGLPITPIQGMASPAGAGGTEEELAKLRYRIECLEQKLHQPNALSSDNDDVASLKRQVDSTEVRLKEALDEVRQTKSQLGAIQELVKLSQPSSAHIAGVALAQAAPTEPLAIPTGAGPLDAVSHGGSCASAASAPAASRGAAAQAALPAEPMTRAVLPITEENTHCASTGSLPHRSRCLPTQPPHEMGTQSMPPLHMPHMRSSPCIQGAVPPSIRMGGEPSSLRPMELQDQEFAPAGFGTLLTRLSERNRPLLHRIMTDPTRSRLSRDFLQACVSADAATESGRRRQQEFWSALGKQERQRLKQVWLLAEAQQDEHVVQRAYSGPSGPCPTGIEAKLHGWSMPGTPQPPQPFNSGGRPVVVPVESRCAAPRQPEPPAYGWIHNTPTPMQQLGARWPPPVLGGFGLR